MYATEFLLLAMVLVAVILFVALRPEDDVRPTKEESSSSRWRRFRIAAGRLATGGRGDAVVREEPDGLELDILEGNLESLPVLLGDGSPGVAVRLERRQLRCQPVHVLRLGVKAGETSLTEGVHPVQREIVVGPAGVVATYSYPERPRPVFVDARCPLTVARNGSRLAVHPVEPVLGTDPEDACSILEDPIHPVGGQAVGIVRVMPVDREWVDPPLHLQQAPSG